MGIPHFRSSLFTIHYSRFTAFLLFTFTFSLSPAVSAQRDEFTPEEVELIRDAQEIDKRIQVLTQIIDRRFAALKTGSTGGPPEGLQTGELPTTRPAKDSEKWGELPQSTRFQLLLDVKRILQKAIDDIDSLAERPDSIVIGEPEKGKKPKGYADLFPKAVRVLAAAAERYRPALKMELDRKNEAAETGSILDALDSCDQIIAAVAKLPPEPAKKKGKNR